MFFCIFCRSDRDVSMGDVGIVVFCVFCVFRRQYGRRRKFDFCVFCSSKKKLERDREIEDVGMVRCFFICYLWT